MKFPRLIFAFLALFTVALTLAACGGDDALSDEEYFQRMDEVDKEVDAQFEEEVFGVENQNAKDGAEGFVSVASVARDRCNDIKPSRDAKDAHEELCTALGEFVTKAEGAVDELSEDDPVESIFENEAFDSTRVDEAFCAIQDLADAKNIDADVGCDSGESVDPSTLEPVEASEVLIQDFAFDPPHIQVSAGDTVTWTGGTDEEAHTATADDGSFDTGTMNEGDTAEITFEEPGEYSYFCEIHPEMLGLVTVVE